MLLAFVGGVMAQSLQFELEGRVFEEGEEITCTNDIYGYGEIVQEMQIRNLTNGDLDVVVEQELVEGVEGALVSFCFGNCFAPGVNVTNPVTIPAQSLNTEDLSFHVMFTEETGAVLVKYIAHAQDDPDHVISMMVRFVYDPSGVSESVATMGHAYPNPASSVVRFNVQGTEKASIAIFNLLGQEVLRQDVEAGQVAISVAGLDKGIYFCNLMVNGEAVSTEKLVVK